jgi:hypothetical protein
MRSGNVDSRHAIDNPENPGVRHASEPRFGRALAFAGADFHLASICERTDGIRPPLHTRSVGVETSVMVSMGSGTSSMRRAIMSAPDEIPPIRSEIT